MLFSLCWSSSYGLKTLMNDLTLILSQIKSFNILKLFCLYLCKQNNLPCEFGAFGFWKEWDVLKIGWKLKGFPQLMCRI